MVKIGVEGNLLPHGIRRKRIGISIETNSKVLVDQGRYGFPRISDIGRQRSEQLGTKTLNWFLSGSFMDPCVGHRPVP